MFNAQLDNIGNQRASNENDNGSNYSNVVSIILPVENAERRQPCRAVQFTVFFYAMSWQAEFLRDKKHKKTNNSESCQLSILSREVKSV